MQILHRYHNNRWIRITTDWAKERVAVVFERDSNRVQWRPGDTQAYEDAFKILAEERST